MSQPNKYKTISTILIVAGTLLFVSGLFIRNTTGDMIENSGLLIFAVGLILSAYKRMGKKES